MQSIQYAEFLESNVRLAGEYLPVTCVIPTTADGNNISREDVIKYLGAFAKSKSCYLYLHTCSKKMRILVWLYFIPESWMTAPRHGFNTIQRRAEGHTIKIDARFSFN